MGREEVEVSPWSHLHTHTQGWGAEKSPRRLVHKVQIHDPWHITNPDTTKTPLILRKGLSSASLAGAMVAH